MESGPNQTVYVCNLNEKLSRDALKKCLLALFSQFGPIVSISCRKTNTLRGQAWVGFADITAATNALRNLQGFPFFEKPIKIQYAKTKGEGKGDARKDKRKRPDITAGGSTVEGGSSRRKGESSRDAMETDEQDGGKVPPNKILFVQNLPEATNEVMLKMLFDQFPGFKEVRMVESRPGIAFVEFETEHQATVGKEGLQGFQINPQHAMNIAFAKQ